MDKLVRVPVRLDGRRFMVVFDDGHPQRIVERCQWQHSVYLKGVADRTIWSVTFARNGNLPKRRSSLIARVLNAAGYQPEEPA